LSKPARSVSSALPPGSTTALPPFVIGMTFEPDLICRPHERHVGSSVVACQSASDGVTPWAARRSAASRDQQKCPGRKSGTTAGRNFDITPPYRTELDLWGLRRPSPPETGSPATPPTIRIQPRKGLQIAENGGGKTGCVRERYSGSGRGRLDLVQRGAERPRVDDELGLPSFHITGAMPFLPRDDHRAFAAETADCDPL
jgi:hypothetical protein